MKEDYVSFETAKLLKEKGFDIPCDNFYDSSGKTPNESVYGEVNIETLDYNADLFVNSGFPKFKTFSAPTLQMAIKWLREEKRTSIIIEFDLTKRGYCPYVHQLDYDMYWVVKWRINTPMKYEEAIEAALKYVLENLI